MAANNTWHKYFDVTEKLLVLNINKAESIKRQNILENIFSHIEE